MVRIAPSILAADFLHLEKDVRIADEHADIIHLDVMDGVFVPNISFGFPVAEAVVSIASKPVDVHLMIVEPEKYALKFVRAGAGMVSFHLNAASDPAALAEAIRGAGAVPGMVINPDIPVESLFPYLRHCGYVLLMSVFAGFGGQKFIEETYGRIRAVKEEITKHGYDCQIEVDGGVSAANARLLADAGADILVAGSAVFKAPDPAAAIRAMR